MGGVDDTLARIKVRGNVGACTACGLREVASQPVAFSGPNPAKIAVVGEAPSLMEDATGEPFVDESGDFIRATFTELLFDLSGIAYLYAVSCFADRTPTAAEVATCTPNLTSQLELIKPSYVLALGGVAVRGLRGDSPRLGEIRGVFWKAMTTPSKPLVMATWHPLAVLRNHSLKEQFEADIAYFGLVADQDLTEGLRGLYCMKCGSPNIAYKDDLAFCPQHMPKEPKRESKR